MGPPIWDAAVTAAKVPALIKELLCSATTSVLAERLALAARLTIDLIAADYF